MFTKTSVGTLFIALMTFSFSGCKAQRYCEQEFSVDMDLNICNRGADLFHQYARDEKLLLEAQRRPLGDFNASRVNQQAKSHCSKLYGYHTHNDIFIKQSNKISIHDIQAAAHQLRVCKKGVEIGYQIATEAFPEIKCGIRCR